ncbi:hypothetical protein [Roseibium sp.]|uniref:hypothetical protein n=1 Tax=Roseibium sp. TaxID=1936156 RepID=UPI003BAC36F2
MANEDFSNVNRLLIKPIAPLYSRVPGGNKKGFFRAVCRQLASFDQRVLSAAAKSLAERARGSTWPNVGELFDACKAAQAEFNRQAEAAARADQASAQDGKRFPLPDRAAIAVMVTSDRVLCERAIDGGFAHLVFEHVKEHHEMPPMETCEEFYLQAADRLKKAQAAFDANPSKITRCLLDGITGRRRMVADLILAHIAQQADRGTMDEKAAQAQP